MQEQPGLSKNGNTTNKQSHHLDLLVDKAANANVASQPAAVNPSFLTTEGCQYYEVHRCFNLQGAPSVQRGRKLRFSSNFSVFNMSKMNVTMFPLPLHTCFTFLRAFCILLLDRCHDVPYNKVIIAELITV